MYKRQLSTIAPEQGDSARIRTQWLDDRIHADITEVLPEYEQHATDCSASAQAAKERAEQIDVYKRQHQYHVRAGELESKLVFVSHVDLEAEYIRALGVAVSYTHLDVYKRQARACA